MLARLLSGFAVVLVSITFPLASDAALLYAIRSLDQPDPSINRFAELITIDTDSGEVNAVGFVDAPLSFGGIDIDEAGQLYWFGAEWATTRDRHGNRIPPENSLYRIDASNGTPTKIAGSLGLSGGQTAEGFAIINGTGYTVRHELRGNTGFAQLYTIDLNNGSPTQIGTGEEVATRADPSDGYRSFWAFDKTVGLATDGASLYGVRLDGRIDEWSLDTGQIVSTLTIDRSLQQHLAFADDRFWFVDRDSNEILNAVDPVEGTITPVPLTGNARSVIALTSARRSTYTPFPLFPSDVSIGVTEAGFIYPTRPGLVVAYAPVQLEHGKTIKSLRCFVDNGGKGHIKASIERVDMTRRPISSVSSETVVKVSSSRRSASVYEEASWSATPDRTMARVDNRRYAYFAKIVFNGVFSGSVPGIGGDTIYTNLVMRGCVIEVD